MKLYEIVIKPVSFFGTPLKGDTIFGHFMWQILMDNSLVKKPIDELIDSYKHNPFVVFSSAYPKLYAKGKDNFFVKRPDLPLEFWQNNQNFSRVDTIKDRKKWRKKKYLKIGRDLKVICKKENLYSEQNIAQMYAEEIKDMDLDIQKIEIDFSRIRNKINRLTSTTGEGFAPYEVKQFAYLPFMEMSVFVLYDETAIDIDKIEIAFERIGQMGFGKDASIGLGRFNLGDSDELDLPDFSDCHALYTLSPCVPEKRYKKCFFQPFVRFGKHGSFFATSRNPFKNPVLMMDEGAVIIDEDKPKMPYIGKALTDLSKIEKRTVSQGYSIVLPLFFSLNGEFNHE